MAALTFEEYKGKQIYYFDCSNASVEEGIKLLEQMKAYILTQPYESILSLINLRQFQFNHKAVEAFKEYIILTKLHVKRSAVVGIHGSRRFIIDMIMRHSGSFIFAFDNLTRAKEWLVDRRFSPRIVDMQEVVVHLHGMPDVLAKGVTSTLSMGGLSLVLDREIVRETMLDLLLQLPLVEKPLVIQGRVVWCQKSMRDVEHVRYSVGVEFVQIAAADYQKLYEYIFKIYEGPNTLR